MKNVLKFKNIVVIALVAILSFSCDNDDETTTADNTVTGLAVKRVLYEEIWKSSNGIGTAAGRDAGVDGRLLQQDADKW